MDVPIFYACDTCKVLHHYWKAPKLRGVPCGGWAVTASFDKEQGCGGKLVRLPPGRQRVMVATWLLGGAEAVLVMQEA